MATLLSVPEQDFLQKTLDAQLLEGVTAAATLNNTTAIKNLPGVMIVDRIDTNGEETPSKREVIQYTATSGATVTTLTRGLAGTTDQDHAVGAIVEFAPDIVWAQSVYDVITAEHDTTGSHTKTVTNMPLTTPKITTSINDANGNEVIKTPATASAVNEITVTNATTTNAPEISATGGDTNIDLKLAGKGTGKVKISNAYTLPSSDGTANQVLLTNGSGVLSFGSATNTDGWISTSETWTYASASTFTVTGDVTVKYQKGTRLQFTQTSVKYAVVVGSSHAGGTTTVTIAVNTDYTIANAAITSPYYSYDASPQGYPTSFSFTGVLTGFAAGRNLTCKYSILGNQINIYVPADVAGTSNATTMTVTGMPVSFVSGPIRMYTTVRNNGSDVAGIYLVNGTTLEFYVGPAAGAFTNSGTKGIFDFSFFAFY